MKNWYFLSGFLFTFFLFHACSIDPMGAPSKIEGKVVNAANEGMKDVNVSCITIHDTVLLTTDDAGFYEIDFPGGSIALMEFSKPEYLTEKLVFQTSGLHEFTTVRLLFEADAAFITVPQTSFIVQNKSSYLNIIVKSNIDFTVTSPDSWLSPAKSTTGISVYYSNNPLFMQRTGKINLEGKYNRRATITVTQTAH